MRNLVQQLARGMPAFQVVENYVLFNFNLINRDELTIVSLD